MTDTTTNQEGADALQAIKIFGMQWMDYFASVQQLAADYVRLQQRVAELEEENRKLKEDDEQLRKADEWTQRVTYDNVVELIANNEDAAQRDISRKVFEPLLKKEQVRQLRRDIKRRVRELNEADEAEQKLETGEVPAVLLTDEAEALMDALVSAVLLHDNWMPNRLSGAERALVAKSVCDRLDVNEVWQVFGQLWGEKPETLRRYFNKALEQKKSLGFQDRMKEILS